MRLSQIFFLIREGFRNTWQNRLMALASVSVLVCCLMLTGFSYILYANVEQMFQNAYSENVMAVYLDTSLNDTQVASVGKQLRGIDNVNEIEFLSKEDFLANYGEALSSDVMDSFSGENNPLPDTYIVTMKDLALFEDTLTRIQDLDGVDEVSYDAGTAAVLVRIYSGMTESVVFSLLVRI